MDVFQPLLYNLHTRWQFFLVYVSNEMKALGMTGFVSVAQVFSSDLQVVGTAFLLQPPDSISFSAYQSSQNAIGISTYGPSLLLVTCRRKDALRL